MSDDIVTRLRVKDGVYTEFWQQKLMDEAADEIERLRAVLDAIDALHQRWMSGAITDHHFAADIHRLLHPAPKEDK